MKTLQRTLTIVKPDAVRKNAVGDIIEQFEKNGFRILAMKMLEISKHQAEQFYAVHAGRPFFNSLTDFMSSGPIVVLALEKENAIADLRKLMGATNPAQRRGRHHPQEVGDEHRAQRDPRLGCRRHRSLRAELFLRRIRIGEMSTQYLALRQSVQRLASCFNWRTEYRSTLYAHGSNHDAAGRTADQKRKIAKRITDALVEEAGRTAGSHRHRVQRGLERKLCFRRRVDDRQGK